MEAGTESVEWVTQEFARADLCDKRLDRRLLKTAEQLAKSPSSPINEACGNWASTQAAYRLFNNPKASTPGILKPHREATAGAWPVAVGRCWSCRTRCSSRTAATSRPAAWDRSARVTRRMSGASIMHNALAFTTSGVPLGILSQSIWARAGNPRGRLSGEDRAPAGHRDRGEGELEVAGGAQGDGRAGARGRTGRHGGGSGVGLLRVLDAGEGAAREVSDPCAHRSQARARRQRGLRAACSRRSATRQRSGTMTVEVPSNGSRKARTANIEVRVAQVTIQAPQRRGAHAKASGSSEPVLVTLIGATEQSAPAGASRSVGCC